MKSVTSTALALLLAGTAMQASAENNYWGIAYQNTNYDEEGIGDVDIPTAALKIGTHLNDYFSIEGRLGTGITDDSVDVFVPGFGSVDVDVELDYFIGVYGIGRLANDTPFTPYALIGYTQVELEASAAGVSADADDSDFSFGLGIEYAFAENNAINLEYASYFDKDGGEISGLTLGINFGF